MCVLFTTLRYRRRVEVGNRARWRIAKLHRRVAGLPRRDLGYARTLSKAWAEAKAFWSAVAIPIYRETPLWIASRLSECKAPSLLRRILNNRDGAEAALFRAVILDRFRSTSAAM